MSNEVIQSVPDQDPSHALLDLERFDSSDNITAPFSVFRGPFGVSKFSLEPGYPSTSVDGTIQTFHSLTETKNTPSLLRIHGNHGRDDKHDKQAVQQWT